MNDLSSAKVVVFHSAKGGVGKSVLLRNFSCYLADKGHKVAIYETSIGGNLNKMMGVFSSTTLSSELSSDQIAFEADAYGVSLLAHGHKIVVDEEEKHMTLILSLLKRDFDYVLIDTDHWISLSNYLALTASDLIVLVADYNQNALYRTAERFEMLTGNKPENGMGISAEKIMGFVNKVPSDVKENQISGLSFPFVTFRSDDDFRRSSDNSTKPFIAGKNDPNFNQCMEKIYGLSVGKKFENEKSEKWWGR